MIRAVPYGQYLRARRICSTESTFHQQADDLRQRFKDRGYSNRNIKKAYNRAKVQQRSQLLRPKQPLPTNEQILQAQDNSLFDTSSPAQQKVKQVKIYYATCPCTKIYVGLTTRAMKIRVREHVWDINLARATEVLEDLKPLAKHFKQMHNCDPSILKIRGIDHIDLDYVTVLCFLLMRVFMNMESYSSDP
ncbi:uncharacterized protein LOC130284811 isoform X3 [Hyla sarda]|uniref:uncharacterized protein LOC130284811 isoform X3 n=1 Tax=Hyla sarda TaxID=327740 RepID=UPI0024C2C098|nr:uncharacterized protein LOC130284811 isoform X3 [Hyla sarda]